MLIFFTPIQFFIPFEKKYLFLCSHKGNVLTQLPSNKTRLRKTSLSAFNDASLNGQKPLVEGRKTWGGPSVRHLLSHSDGNKKEYFSSVIRKPF